MSKSRRQRDHKRTLHIEPLEDRRVLATTPVLQDAPSITAGPIDFLWIRGDAYGREYEATTAQIEEARDAIDDYYRRNSSGLASLGTFDITPELNVTGTINNLGQLQAAFRAAAVNAGYDLSNYTRIAYGFPNPPFSIGGGAVGSGTGAGGSLSIPDVVHTQPGGVNGIVHESLHSLGLGHSINVDNRGEILPNRFTSGVGGLDPYHFLGAEGQARANADIATYQKYRLGWIGPSNLTVAPEDPTGVYRIYQSDSDSIPTDRKVMLQIGDYADGSAVVLSYLPDVPNPALETRGVLAHYIQQGSEQAPRLLDLTPGSSFARDPDSTELNLQWLADLWDAAAEVGQTSAIPFVNFEFTPIATGGSGDAKWVDIEVKKSEVATVDTNQTEFRYDFGPVGSVEASGFRRLTPLTGGDIRWDESVDSASRVTGGVLNQDFVSSSGPRTLSHELQNGVWQVSLTFGDADSSTLDMQVSAEGVLIDGDIDAPAGQFQTVVSNVTVTDGELNLDFDAAGDWKLTQMTLVQQSVIVDTDQNVYNYDFGPAGSAIESVITGFAPYRRITPETTGDIQWSGAVNASEVPSFTVGSTTYPVGDLSRGLQGDDSASGVGYILYSEERLKDRFEVRPDLSEHLMVVRYQNGQWEHILEDPVWQAFTPKSTDRLIAQINFNIDVVSPLAGLNDQFNGINRGYTSSNLTFLANSFDGSFDNGEFQVLGPSGNVSNLHADYVSSSVARTLEHKIDNGVWRVTLNMGDANQQRDNMVVRAEGVTVSGDVDSPAGQFSFVDTSGASTTETTFDVHVTDGSLSLEFSDAGGLDPEWVLNRMSLERVGIYVDTNTTSFDYDFGSIYSIVEPGFDLITPSFQSGDVRFNGAVNTRDRYTAYTSNAPQAYNRDVIAINAPRTLEHKVANGVWRVTLNMGDVWFSSANVSVRAEGELISDDLDTFTNFQGRQATESEIAYVTREGKSLTPASFDVIVSDGSLSLDLSGSSWVVTRLSLEQLTGPYVTTPIADVDVAANAPNTAINLNNHFTDSTGDTLTYTVANNTNESLVATSVNGSTLTLDYADTGSGFANITIRATDPGGEFTEDTFLVGVDIDPNEIFVDLSATQYDYDFGTETSGVANGFVRISPATFGDVNWTGGTINAIERNSNALNGDLVFANGFRTLNHTIANGTWEVTLAAGDPNNFHDNFAVSAEGQLINGDIDTSTGQILFVIANGESATEATFEVVVSDGELNLNFNDLGGADPNWVFTRLSLTRVPETPGDYNGNDTVEAADYTAWSSSFGATPPDGTGADGNSDGVISASDYVVWRDNFTTVSAALEVGNTSNPDRGSGGCSCGGAGCPACLGYDPFFESYVSASQSPVEAGDASSPDRGSGGCSCGGAGCSACLGYDPIFESYASASPNPAESASQAPVINSDDIDLAPLDSIPAVNGLQAEASEGVRRSAPANKDRAVSDDDFDANLFEALANEPADQFSDTDSRDSINGREHPYDDTNDEDGQPSLEDLDLALETL